MVSSPDTSPDCGREALLGGCWDRFAGLRNHPGLPLARSPVDRDRASLELDGLELERRSGEVGLKANQGDGIPLMAKPAHIDAVVPGHFGYAFEQPLRVEGD